MKVLLTVTGAWGTGSFQVAKGIALRLIADGHQARIFFPDSRLESKELDEYYLPIRLSPNVKFMANFSV